jgi:hypothetical protein
VDAEMCGPCQEVYVSDEFVVKNDLEDARCIFAIELVTGKKK